MTGTLFRSRADHGLDSGPDSLNWRQRAACHPAVDPDVDPEWWASTSGGPAGISTVNAKAMAICRQDCPVREECRDDVITYLRSGRRLVSTIVGGWRIDHEGQVIGVPDGEQHLIPPIGSTDGRSRRGTRGPRLDPTRGAIFVAAGRSVEGGEEPEAVSARCGLNVSSVKQAASLVAHGNPETVRAVAAGETSINAAVAELRRSGRARAARPR